MVQSDSPTQIELDADTRFLRALIERIRKGTCVLVLGEDVALDPEGSGRLVTTMLAEQLALDPDVVKSQRLQNADSPRHVAELFYQIKHDRDELAIAVRDFYSQFVESTTNFHKDIASLPFKLCVSTTHDDFYYNALLKNDKKPVKACYNLRRERDLQLPEPTKDTPLIYHLLGHPMDLDSLVLTESDLIDFLVKLIQGSPALPDRIRGYMGDPETSFLFIGFGFQHWSVRVLLHVLRVYGHRNKSVALEKSAFFDNPASTQTIAFFSGDHAIEFRQVLWADFARILAELEKTTGQTEVKELPEVPPDAPRVFICYASEDTEAIEQLSAKLTAAGIAVWRDKQNLRGGDNWDRILIHVIENQVDYVLVAQSQAMGRRIKGYFFKEIQAALKQKEELRPDLLFLIPAKIESCDGMEELRNQKLHELDISTEAGFQTLLLSIRDDWSKRCTAHQK